MANVKYENPYFDPYGLLEARLCGVEPIEVPDYFTERPAFDKYMEEELEFGNWYRHEKFFGQGTTKDHMIKLPRRWYQRIYLHKDLYFVKRKGVYIRNLQEAQKYGY